MMNWKTFGRKLSSFTVISWNLPGGMDRNCGTPQSGFPTPA
jgi:hypothetical protein